MADEQLLIEQAKLGDMEAFRELVERSKINVYRLAYDMVRNRHDAEDVSQDVFLQAYRSLSLFRGEAKWSTWLYRITVNKCLDHRKSTTRKSMEYREDIGNAPHSEMPHHHSEGITPDRAAGSSLLQKHIERALDCLSPRERAVFVLRHYHDLSLKQIAETLTVTEGTIKSHLFRAVQQLQRELAYYRDDLGLEKQL